MFLLVFLPMMIVGVIIGSIAAVIVAACDGPVLARFLVGFGVAILAALFAFLFVKPWAFVDNYELGYIYDSRTGQIEVVQHTGYVPRIPFFQNVHTIDLRPRQVCINVGNQQGSYGPNQRVLNCKLVSFNPKGLQLFVSWHGRGDYSDDTLNDLLKIYAYDPSGRSYPFLNVSDETRPVVGSQSIGQPIPFDSSPIGNAQ